MLETGYERILDSCLRRNDDGEMGDILNCGSATLEKENVWGLLGRLVWQVSAEVSFS